MARRCRELEFPFDQRAAADRQRCCSILHGGPRDGQACGNVASHQIDGRFLCAAHAAPAALEILSHEPDDQDSIWIRFHDTKWGRTIGKWDAKPFEGGARYQRRD